MTQWNPNCKGPCDCPGTEREDLLALRDADDHSVHVHAAIPMPPDAQAALAVVLDETWSLNRSLAGAWAWGYAAAQRDALDKPIMGGPGASEWKPTPNPYTVQFECEAHKPVQHRDRKRPWCNACGRDTHGELIGRPGILR